VKLRFFILATHFFLACSAASGVWADTLEVLEESPEPIEERVEAPKPADLRRLRLENRVNDLERVVRGLKDEIHFLEEKVENLERRIDDIRFRHT